MKCLLVLFGALWLLMPPQIYCVPMTVLNNDLSDSTEDDDDSVLLDDDITTRGLARLSSAATCLVAGVEYTHGQQIYRADQCEFCLCLDGEMFCWWQDCPPALEGPCKNQGPFSPCESIPVAPTPKPPMSPSTKKNLALTTTQLPMLSEEQQAAASSTNNDALYSTTSSDLVSDTSSSSTEESLISSTEETKSCIVMGQQYQVGQSLPHSTGNCLECICGPGSKITCAPHECEPAGQEITDYRPPGPIRQGTDIF